MFKKYSMKWSDVSGCEHKTDFYVNSKNTRNGFMHRACVVGPLPRLDDMGKDWSQYRENENVLFGKRVTKVSYCNRTWESWPGKQCLSKLWERLCKLKFVDMGRIHEGDPFSDDKEPDHEDLREPDELFAGFSR